jgi:hypothetical protein
MTDSTDLQRVQSPNSVEPKQEKPPNGEERDVGDFLGIFGEATVPVILISFGLVFAAAAVGAEWDTARGWAVPEFFGGLAFGALLVLLGCLERLVQIRSDRTPAKELPPVNPPGTDAASH